MELELNVFAFIGALFTGCAIISAFTVAVLLLRQPSTLRPFWLLLLVVTVAGHLVQLTVSIGRIPNLSPHFYYLPVSFTFVIGPALYFYVRTLLQPNRAWQRRDWLHWMLPIVQAIIVIGVGFASVQVKHQFWQEVELPWYGLLEQVWLYISLIGYVVAALQLVQNTVASRPSEAGVAPTTIAWLRRLVFVTLISVFGVVLIDVALPLLLSSLRIADLYSVSGYEVLSPLVMSLALFWTSSNAYLYTLRARIVPAPTKVRQETYNIGDDALASNATRLHDLMDTQAVYRDPDLTLRSLAGKLDLTSKQLSYVINESTGQNFNGYVNQRRIEAVKLLLRDPSNKHRSVLELGFDVGFSSKSTFNRVFKETVGSSPSQFRSLATSGTSRPKSS